MSPELDINADLRRLQLNILLATREQKFTKESWPYLEFAVRGEFQSVTGYLDALYDKRVNPFNPDGVNFLTYELVSEPTHADVVATWYTQVGKLSIWLANVFESFLQAWVKIQYIYPSPDLYDSW